MVSSQSSRSESPGSALFTSATSPGTESPPTPGPGLEYIPESKLDHRSDEEIITQLRSYQEPTSSDKNVWAFWNTGFDSMPPWTQRNVINWVRRLGPSWTVRVLDQVPGSPLNVSRFVDASLFPEAFNNRTMTGPYVGQHSGDLVRLPLLYLYGGVWMDVGMILFRHIDDICWNAITNPTTPYEMSGFAIEICPGTTNMLNGFIATRRGNGLIKRWHDIFLELWKGATESKGFHKHPLLAHLPLMYAQAYHLNLPMALKISPEDFTDYLAHFQCFERLRRIIDPTDGFDGPEYYREKMYLLPAMQEMLKFQSVTKWSGARQFELLNTKREGDGVVQIELYHHAEKIVLDLLANTSTMKLSHGPKGALEPFLADMWDDPKNHNKDIEAGTFAAYLRYGSVHFDQTRVIEPMKPTPMTGEILHIGVLQPKVTHETDIEVSGHEQMYPVDYEIG